MTIRRVLSVLATLTTLLILSSASAQNARRAEDPASRPEPAKVSRPARVVASSTDTTVNINAADVKELMTLAGVNRKTAQRIIAYREAHGPFKRADDVKKVEGLSDALWEKNRPRIAVR